MGKQKASCQEVPDHYGNLRGYFMRYLVLRGKRWDNTNLSDLRTCQGLERKLPVFGRSLHTQTSPQDTKEALALGESLAITSPSARYRRGYRGA
jgi:hypothetical protein